MYNSSDPHSHDLPHAPSLATARAAAFAATPKVHAVARRPAPDALVYDISEVMYLLKIGRTRAYELCQAHALEHYKEGDSIRVPAEAIVKYLKFKPGNSR